MISLFTNFSTLTDRTVVKIFIQILCTTNFSRVDTKEESGKKIAKEWAW